MECQGVCPKGAVVVAEGIDERDVRSPQLNRVKLRVKLERSTPMVDELMPRGYRSAAGHDKVGPAVCDREKDVGGKTVCTVKNMWVEIILRLVHRKTTILDRLEHQKNDRKIQLKKCRKNLLQPASESEFFYVFRK